MKKKNSQLWTSKNDLVSLSSEHRKPRMKLISTIISYMGDLSSSRLALSVSFFRWHCWTPRGAHLCCRWCQSEPRGPAQTGCLLLASHSLAVDYPALCPKQRYSNPSSNSDPLRLLNIYFKLLCQRESIINSVCLPQRAGSYILHNGATSSWILCAVLLTAI